MTRNIDWQAWIILGAMLSSFMVLTAVAEHSAPPCPEVHGNNKPCKSCH